MNEAHPVLVLPFSNFELLEIRSIYQQNLFITIKMENTIINHISTNHKCVSCLEEILSDNWIALTNCGHEWCQECLERNVKQSMKSQANWPPRCCRKFTKPELEQVKDLISDKLVQEWKAKEEELNASNPTANEPIEEEVAGENEIHLRLLALM
ncbi:hypothetical protein DV735_g3345, partial [Chaetothyriales sp. CBS 134920]